MATFESGSIGGDWALSAVNGVVTTPNGALAVRDLTVPVTNVVPRFGSTLGEPVNNSCVWSFVSAADQVPDGAFARLVSPWITIPANQDTVIVGFGARFNTLAQRRALKVFVRAKSSGDARPLEVGQPLTWLTDIGAGGDAGTVYEPVREMRFPQDFTGVNLLYKPNQVQLVFEVADRAETDAAGFSGREATGLPRLDDIYIATTRGDQDGDGVPDAQDACVTVAPQRADVDGNGCQEATATFNATQYWPRSRGAMHYKVSSTTCPTCVTPEIALPAIRAGFAAWAQVDGADISFVEDPPADIPTARAADGINSLVFTDPTLDGKHPWDSNIVAITFRTVFDQPTSFLDRIALPGEIVDADIRFNPAYRFTTPEGPQAPEYYDLQSIVTHEGGHMIGLAHSVHDQASMYATVLPGTRDQSSLTDEDRGAVASIYPSPTLTTTYGQIRGTLTSGATNQPIEGAVMLAIRRPLVGSADSIVAVDYTAADGSYLLQRLAPGHYWVMTRSLTEWERDNVSRGLRGIAAPNVTAEYWDLGEDDADGDARDSMLVAAGGTLVRNIVTDRDVSPPRVNSIRPPRPGGGDVYPDEPIVVDFSEPVDGLSLVTAFRLVREGDTLRVAGKGSLLDRVRWVFVPTDPLDSGTNYKVKITAALKDANGVSIAQPESLSFHTRAADTPAAIQSVEPASAPVGAVVTLAGDQFVPGSSYFVRFACSGCGGFVEAPAANVHTRWMTAVVPANAESGPLSLRIGGAVQAGGPVFTVQSGRVVPVASAAGSGLSLGFAPSGLAIAPDGTHAYAVGSSGLQEVLVSAGMPALGQPRAGWGAMRSVLFHPSPLERSMFLTQPELGRVLWVNAASNDPNYLSPRDTLEGAARAEAFVTAAHGLRAYSVSPSTHGVSAWNIDIGGTSRGERVAHWQFPDSSLDGVVAIDPTGRWLVLSSPEGGLFAFGPLDETWPTPMPIAPASALGGAVRSISCSPQGDRWLVAAGNSRQLIEITGTLPSGPFTTTVLPTSGRVQDVSWIADGTLTLATASSPSQLVVTDLASGSEHGKALASAPLASSPGLVRCDRAATYAFASSPSAGNLTFFSLTGAASLTKLVPPAALAGDVAVAIGSAQPYPGGSQVEVAQIGTPVLATSAVSGAASFVLPVAEPQATSASVVPPISARTLALPMRILSPISLIDPAPTPFAVPETRDTCVASGNAGNRPFRWMRTSPDGAWLAVARGPLTVGACSFPAAIEFYRAGEDVSPGHFGELLQRVSLATGLIPADGAFLPGGTEFWVAGPGATGGFLQRIACSTVAGFQTIGATNTDPALGVPTQIAADPLGRHMYVASRSTNRVNWIALDGTSIPASYDMGSHAPRSLAPSPDGKRLWIGGEDRLWSVDAVTASLQQSSTVHAGQPVTSLALSSNGKRIAGAVAPGSIGVWSAESGSLANQLWFGKVISSADTLRDFTPSPSGTGVLARIAGVDSLVEFAIGGASPVARVVHAGGPVTGMARAMDGRSLWIARTGGDRDPVSLSNNDAVSPLLLSDVGDFQLVSGANQALGVNAQLQPVVVRVMDGKGLPVPGAPVRFVLPSASAGQLQGAAPGGLVATRLTDGDGFASVVWTLPASPGVRTMTVTEPHGTSLAVSATAATADAGTRPYVVESGPAETMTAPLLTSSRFFMRFNQRMNRTSVASHLTVTAGGSPIAGHLEWFDDDHKFVFTPEQILPFSASGSFSLTGAVEDFEGDLLVTDKSVPFSTESAPLTAAIDYLSPNAAPPGAMINIVGRGFSPQPNQNVVWFLNRRAFVNRASEGLLEVVVPADAVTGGVYVQVVGAALPTNTVTFTLAPAQPPTTTTVDAISIPRGGRDIALSVDGKLAFILNPAANNVSVFDLGAGVYERSIAVGRNPTALAVHPNGRSLYVAAAGSRDVSIVNVKSGTEKYLKRTGHIELEFPPSAISIFVSSGHGHLLALSADGSGVFDVDIEPNSSSYGTVVKSVKTPTTSTTFAITADAGRCWIGSTIGVQRLDLGDFTLHESTDIPSGVASLDFDRRSGGMLFGASRDGRLVVLDASETSSRFGTVLAQIDPPARVTSVKSSPSGSLLYAVAPDENKIFQYSFQGGFATGSTGAATEPVPLTYELLRTISDGDSPMGVATSPDGQFAMVANEGSSFVTRLSLDSSPPVQAQLEMPLDLFDLGNLTGWTYGRVELPAGFAPEHIKGATVRFAGMVAADTTRTLKPFDTNDNSLDELPLAFPNDLIRTVVGVGDSVEITVTGKVDNRTFVARDTTNVRRGYIDDPRPGQPVRTGATRMVFFDPALAPSATSVVLLSSRDGGDHWAVVATGLPNSGHAIWAVPDSVTDHARVAVLQVEQTIDARWVRGVLSTSDEFPVLNTLEVENGAPVVPELALASPNPNSAGARLRFRFPTARNASLEIYDLQGRVVRTLFRGRVGVDWQEAEWDGLNSARERIGAGVYFARLRADGADLKKRIVLVR